MEGEIICDECKIVGNLVLNSHNHNIEGLTDDGNDMDTLTDLLFDNVDKGDNDTTFLLALSPLSTLSKSRSVNVSISMPSSVKVSISLHYSRLSCLQSCIRHRWFHPPSLLQLLLLQYMFLHVLIAIVTTMVSPTSPQR